MTDTQIFDPQWWSFLSAPAKRADRDEARMLHRLAAKAVALAAEYGETLTWRDAIKRSRENLAYVRGKVMVKEAKW